MSEKKLFTIGYEGSELEDFLATLLACNISLVLDVRDLPLSRKRGFSKNALSAALEAKSVDYIHLKDLGDPKPGREAARTGNLALFKKIYSQHLQTEGAKKALDTARKLAQSQTSCLLCFERSNDGCHRSIIADRLAKSGSFSIRHIGIKAGISQHSKPKHVPVFGEFAVG